MPLQYPPLGQNELRLLEPVSIGHDFLSFRMSNFRQAAKPVYTAVSYTWGDGAPTETIYINNQPFRVRANLWSCLYYLGQWAHHQTWRHLWVDAICINQNDVQERTAQVRLMDQIYRNALVVSVWLGLPPFPEYLEHLQYSNEPIKTLEDEGFDWSDSLQELTHRPYWSRFWVIQEFLLAQDVEIHCGNTRINWIDFKDALGHRTGGATYLDASFDYSKYETGPWPAWPLLKARHPDLHPEIPQPLYDLVMSHSKSQCKDPRDRIFALLGLVTEEEKGWLNHFFPDYAMSEDDVIIIALSHMRLFNMRKISEESEQILLALGVEDKRRAKRLVDIAEVYDPLHGLRPSECFGFNDEFMDLLNNQNPGYDIDNLQNEDLDYDVDCLHNEDLGYDVDDLHDEDLGYDLDNLDNDDPGYNIDSLCNQAGSDNVNLEEREGCSVQ